MDGGSTWQNFNGGVSLLWTNPSPTASFSPQKINLDLSGFSGVLIKFYINFNGNHNVLGGYVAKGDSPRYVSVNAYNSVNSYWINYGRIGVSVDDSGVTFGTGYLTPNVQSSWTQQGDANGVPTEIYGLTVD